MKYPTEKTEESTTYAQWSYSSFLYGLRLGYKVSDVDFGVDWSKSSMSLSRSGNLGVPIDLNGSYSTSFLGTYVSYLFPYNIIGRYTYYLRSRLKSSASSTEDDTLDGDGFSFYAGYPLNSWFVPGIEYRRHKLEEYTEKSSGTKTITASRYIIKEFIISLSFPLPI